MPSILIGLPESPRPRMSTNVVARTVRRALIGVGVSFVSLTSLASQHTSACAQEPPQGIATLSFASPEHLLSAGDPIDLKHHATTRCFDWDQDGDGDLLVGGGDGKVWLFLNEAEKGGESAPLFSAPQPVTAGNVVRWGESYTGAMLADLNADSLPDLLVAHSDNQLSLHLNQGTRQTPQFAAQAQQITLQAGCQGRFDVGDWNSDGLLDLVTGSFGGEVRWHPNQGSKEQPRYGVGESLDGISVAYNSHPRWFDLDHNGMLDLVLGVNWGSVSVYFNRGTAGAPKLASPVQALWESDGTNLDLRELNSDDTTPEFYDLDADGVLDLVSGGKNGKLFLMRGVGYPERVREFVAGIEETPETLGERLESDETLRHRLFGAIRALHADLASGLITREDGETLFRQLAPLAKRYPELLSRNRFDLERTPHLPMLAAQYWIVMKEAISDSPQDRVRLAEALGFESGYRELLVDTGVIFVDNDTASPEQLTAMHRLMVELPKEVWRVELITAAGWLGPGIKTHSLRARTAINIFDLPLGVQEDSFGSDSPRAGVTDVYLICLAHELAHNMLDTVGKELRPELYERKFAGLSQAAGLLVAYQSPRALGIDFPETQQRFKEAGKWDGDPEHWDEAWRKYFDGKEEFDRAHTRGNIRFFVEAPQEAFATLANQYVADSQLMLEFAKVRWAAGHRSNVNQFLLIADYLSQRADRVPFYQLLSGGKLRVSTAALQWDARGRIVRMTTAESIAEFEYSDDDMVSEFRLRAR